MADKPKFWEKYTNAYDKIMSHYYGHQALVEEHLKRLKGCSIVLESGCGPGHLTKRLLEEGHRVYAVDVNLSALNLLKKRCGNNPNLITECIDANNLPYKNNYFDAVSSMLVLWAIEKPERYLIEIRRILKQKGILVLSGPGPETRVSVNLQLKKIEENLRSQGLFPKIRKNWALFLEYTAKNVSNTAEHWFSHEDIRRLLERTGFKVSSINSNPVYCNQGHIVVAIKI
ncbi:class I SAM-dependent methyltransferase [Candidatus Pacearchaeota archaeon]|nr:class I SAM-dependent methyltransferase [Candidatus Pacearchaeota archaeon]